LDAFGNIDSKYRFIILAAKRAKQLLKGAKPKIQSKSKNLIRIAQSEVRSGLIDYEIIPTRMDDIPEREERVFVGAGLADDAADSEALSAKGLAEDADVVVEEETEDEAESGGEDAEDEDGAAKDNKDE
jgi:DNA-directed RNA polymerase omega subunit